MNGGRLPEWLFESTLRSYPPEFRLRHAGSMRAMFREQWAERSDRHAVGRALFLALILIDSVRNGLAQRLGSFRSGGRRDGSGADSGRQGWAEVAQAARALARRPGFTVLAVGTLALGIGGVASIGSVAYHVLLKRLPYASGEEIVRLWWNGRLILPQLTEYFSASSSMIEHFAAGNRTVRELTWVSARTDATLALAEGAERVGAGSAAPNFFTFLGVVPALGRLDVPADGSSAGLVLSHAEWVGRWGGDPSMVGRTLRMQNAPLAVIGVLPPDFEWIGRTSSIDRADYWIIRSYPPIAGYYYFHPLVKPAAGASVEDVRQDFARSAYAEIAEEREPLLPMVEAATAELLRDDALGPLRIRISFLVASVMFVVLLGALSVSNLLLGRLADRDNEMGVRLSLGASRSDLVRLIAIEATLLATAGALIGTLLARSGIALLRAGAPVGIPRLSSATISPAILAGVVALTILVAIIVLVPPALVTISDSVAGNVRRLAGRGRRRARSRALLIASQMIIATILLIGSSLMLRSLYSRATVDLGFDPGGVIAGRVQLPNSYWTPVSGTGEASASVLSTSAALESDLDWFRQRLSALQGVERVSFAAHVPLSGTYGTRIPLDVEGSEKAEVIDESDLISWNLVDPDFFAVLNVSVIEGRLFRSDDAMPGAAAVAIVSDRLADRYWPGQSAVGRRFSDVTDEVTEDGRVVRRESLVEIVGVVRGLRERGLEEVAPTLYMPRVRPAGLVASPRRNLAFFVSTGPDNAAAIMPAVRRIVAAIFPREPLRHFAPMEETVDGLLGESVFYASLLTIFAGYGVLLSLVGIIGVVHHQVSRRRQEAAVRIALGALPREVIGLLGRETGLSAAAGILIGLSIAAGLSRLIESMLFDVVPLDPWTFVAIPVLFLAAAVAAAVIPGRRLARLSPVEALRAE